jgi:hypothetical protein
VSPEAAHAFSAAQPIRTFPQNPKPRAWLRHTPYPTAEAV